MGMQGQYANPSMMAAQGQGLPLMAMQGQYDAYPPMMTMQGQDPSFMATQGQYDANQGANPFVICISGALTGATAATAPLQMLASAGPQHQQSYQQEQTDLSMKWSDERTGPLQLTTLPPAAGAAFPRTPSAEAPGPNQTALPGSSQPKEIPAPLLKVAPGDYSSLMLRNIPNKYTQEMVLELLDAEGFSGSYDFIYLPWDFLRMSALGYVFVNVDRHDTAVRLKDHFDGFSRWQVVGSQKVCVASWMEVQGLDDLVERYRNSPVMHEDVPEKYKPLLYKHGERVAFPVPTQRVKCPPMKKKKP